MLKEGKRSLDFYDGHSLFSDYALLNSLVFHKSLKIDIDDESLQSKCDLA